MQKEISERVITMQSVRKMDAGVVKDLAYGKEYVVTMRVSVASIESEDNGDGTEKLNFKVKPVGAVDIKEVQYGV